MQKGLFITFEGNDGCGKTTISSMVYETLKQQGYPVIYTREPGGIDIAEQIRHIILNPENTTMDARTEALLYAASRRQHLMEKVLPALQHKQIVLCDRFIDSSLAYQGIGRKIGFDEILKLNEFAVEGHMPDLTVFLDVSLDVGRSRFEARGQKDRLENEAVEFHEAVARGYDMVKERFKERMHIIDANRSIDEVYQDALHTVVKAVKPYA